MARYKMSDVVVEINEREINPANSKYDRFVGLEHYISGDVIIRNYGSTERLESTMKVFHSGDILVARRNVYLKRASMVDFDGITSGDSIVLRAKNPVIGRILPFILNTDEFWDFADKYSDGTMSKRLSPKILMQYEFELPDEDKLDEFSEILWALNETKESYQQLFQQTDELVKSQFIEMFGDPNDVEISSLVPEAFIIRDDLRKPLNDGVRATMKTGKLFPYYGANGKVDEINQYLMDCDALCLAEDCGAYGAGESSSYIVSGKVWVNNHAHVLIPKENCNIRYANEFFRLLDITKYISGSTRAKLTQGQLKNLPFMIPSVDEQARFCAFVEQSDKSKYSNQIGGVCYA